MRCASRSSRGIAVLPFVDRSAEGDQQYFGDGLSEEILNLLAGLRELRVSGRTSSFSFKGTNVSIPEIGRTLGVAHVLESERGGGAVT
jgi:TolB-like protein